MQASAAFDAASTRQTTSQSQQRPSSDSEGPGSIFSNNSRLLRRLLSTTTAAEALDLLTQQLDKQQSSHAITSDDAGLLLENSLSAGNTDLALSVYQQMCTAKRAQSSSGGISSASVWPAATLQHTETLVMGLCRQLRVKDALAIMHSIRSQGVAGSDEVGVVLFAVACAPASSRK